MMADFCATMSAMENKQFSPLAVPTDAGEIALTWATLEVVDKDGDIILPEAVPAGKEVPIMQWGHNLDSIPIGEAAIGVDGNRAVAFGRLYLEIPAAKDHYEVLRARGEKQEWSFSYIVNDYEMTSVDGQPVRVIRSMDVVEISPVLIGAGVGTRTDAIKSGRPLRTHIGMLQADIIDAVERAEALAALRAKEGRVLSRANRELLSELLAALYEAAGRLEELLKSTEEEPVKSHPIVPAYLLDKYAALKTQLGGVTSV